MMDSRVQKRKVRLTVRGIQSGFGQEDISEITTIADYFEKDGKQYIFYSEHTEEGKILKNRFTVSATQAELKKTGNGSSLLKFHLGHSEPCTYQSPAGLLEMISDTKRMDIHVGKKSFQILLEYSFYMSGMLMSNYHLTVEGRFLPQEF